MEAAADVTGLLEMLATYPDRLDAAVWVVVATGLPAMRNTYQEMPGAAAAAAAADAIELLVKLRSYRGLLVAVWAAVVVTDPLATRNISQDRLDVAVDAAAAAAAVGESATWTEPRGAAADGVSETFRGAKDAWAEAGMKDPASTDSWKGARGISRRMPKRRTLWQAW